MNNYANNLDVDRALTEAYAYAAPAEVEIDVNALPEFSEFYAEDSNELEPATNKNELSPEERALSGAAIDRFSRIDKREVSQINSKEAVAYVSQVGLLLGHSRKNSEISRDDSLRLAA